MTNDQVNDILERIRNWPAERRHELAELALEIEAEAGGSDDPYMATAEELGAIDEARDSGIATAEEVAAAFARLRRA
jgi:hypothetical protein